MKLPSRSSNKIPAEESIYFKKYRADLLDNDEISPEEAAFMQGYEED